MARKRMKSKIQPAVTSLFLSPVGIQGQQSETYYVDLSFIASLANRRFYRQGLNWAVAGIKIMTEVTDNQFNPASGTPTGKVTVSKVPTTWVASNAWEKGFRHWQKLNKMSGVPANTFTDFKVYLDEQHYDYRNTTSRFLKPTALAMTGNALSRVGDWDYSKYVIPRAGTTSPGDAIEYDIMFVGDNYPNTKSVVSLIQGYANSRLIGASAFIDPNRPGEMDDLQELRPENWLTAAFNEGTDQDHEVAENLEQQNVQAPYAFENDTQGNTVTMYPGGQSHLSGPQIHAIEPITGTTIGGTTYVNGGSFPCGLMRLDFDNTDSDTQKFMKAIIQIDLVPGDHRGYLAEPMTEM